MKYFRLLDKKVEEWVTSLPTVGTSIESLVLAIIIFEIIMVIL
jgi:hypothetical protein